MSKIDNPFLLYGYEGPEYFCDRKEETEEIVSSLRNGCNITLMSPRRYGKTGLIRHVFHKIKEQDPDAVCFYIDIYATNSLYDFVQTFAKAVVGKLDTPLQKAENIITKIFKSSQITMSTDFMTGLPQLSLNFAPQYTESTLDEIFTYISQSQRNCYIAFDEFQQVTEYPEKNVEALLRTHIQKMNNARFVFSGSRLHMMMEMFNSPKHPFYRSTEKLNLGTLDEAVYYSFAEEKLKEKDVSLPYDAFHELYSMVDGVTWYIQAVLNRLYRLTDKKVTVKDMNEVIIKIILSEEEDYKRLFHLLTANQANLLLAIAREGSVAEPMSGLFLRKHQLKSTSSVQRALKYLADEEYIYLSERGYIIYDRFFGIWLKGL